jgi:hypothetical protein
MKVDIMVLDMESEFYKIAIRILTKPQKLFKMVSISPHTNRVTVMGADNYMVVGTSILRSLTKSKEEKAYKAGFKCGKEMYGNLIEEFDEEVRSQPPKKLMNLGLPLMTNTGWGKLEMLNLSVPKKMVRIKASETIELNYKYSKHHMLTCGLLAAVCSLSLKKDVQGKLVEETKDHVIFEFS